MYEIEFDCMYIDIFLCSPIVFPRGHAHMSSVRYESSMYHQCTTILSTSLLVLIGITLFFLVALVIKRQFTHGIGFGLQRKNLMPHMTATGLCVYYLLFHILHRYVCRVFVWMDVTTWSLLSGILLVLPIIHVLMMYKRDDNKKQRKRQDPLAYEAGRDTDNLTEDSLHPIKLK